MNDMAQIDEKLDAMLDKITETHDAVLLTGADLKAISRTVADLAGAVWGNGKAGLGARMDKAEFIMEAQAKKCAEFQHKCEPPPWWKVVGMEILGGVGKYIVLAIILAIFAVWLENAAPKVVQAMQHTAANAAKP